MFGFVVRPVAVALVVSQSSIFIYPKNTYTQFESIVNNSIIAETLFGNKTRATHSPVITSDELTN